ncbi:helix-turn-helix domain-containing protein [bacterium]|nr:helix-turn-helix domain-containing protein [bacterium]
MPIKPKDVIARIEKERRASGMTQQALADAAGISLRHYQGLLAGRGGMSVEVYLKLCAGLKMEPAEPLTKKPGEAGAVELDEEERRLLKAWRRVNETRRTLVRMLLTERL